MTRRKRNQPPLLLLDTFSVKDLARWDAFKEKILRYHWDLYSALAYERRKIADQIQLALLEAAYDRYEFTGWQRQVRYKYSLSPLSPKGSLIEPGGRFNIPVMNPDQIPPFPALYIAEDKETTMQEAGQQASDTPELSPLDLALTRKDSISIVSVSGKLTSIIDLQQPDKLKPFLDLIKGFAVPKSILRAAKKIGVEDPSMVQSINALLESLLEPNWRAMCMQLDVPANCQIFGQLVANAGIGGILYPSKFTKKKCLAAFPQNFDAEDFVAVDGDAPEGAISRLDTNTWVSVKATL